jgi:hypothetical protein
LITTIATQLLWATVGAVLGILLKPLWDYLASRRGEFTGEWLQVIPPFEGEPEKLATVKIKHVGTRIYGVTERTKPKEAFLQRWKVEGRVQRGLVYGMYWPEDYSKLPGSYGTLQFKIRDENYFEGFYVRVRSGTGADLNEFRDSLKTIPIRWERVAASNGVERP